MVAPVDTFVRFCTPELYRQHRSQFDARSLHGGGRVISDLATGDIAVAVEEARNQLGGSPLGFVTPNESTALEAIAAGADDAICLQDGDPTTITAFLDRIRVRASVRREAERNSQDLAQAEKLTALGTLVAGVGHELNNPLSMITLGFDFLRDALLPDLTAIWRLREHAEETGRVSPEEAAELLRSLRSSAMDVRELLADISEATDSVAQLVQDLRVFSRSNIVEAPTVFQPRAVIEQALRLVRREFRVGTVIEQDYDDDLPELYLPRNRLAQVLTNLLVNAAHAMREVEREIHRLRVTARSDDQHIAISITDTGPGIPDEALERIFDPFFTTKREGQGTGLGLSISQSIIKHLGGDLAVSSIYGDGATFICFLPLPSAEQLRSLHPLERTPLPAKPHQGTRHSVLIIDDDERVLRATARALRHQYKLLIARDGEEAKELLASGSHADVVVMELELSEMDGPTFFDWLAEHQPRLAERTIIATAAQERPEYREFLNQHELTVLEKPLTQDSLLLAVSQKLQETS